MRARNERRRARTGEQPDVDDEGKPVSGIAEIFALAFLRMRVAASARAREAQNSRITGEVSLPTGAPVEASCERVEGAAVNGAESRAEKAEQHDVELEAMC